MAGHTDEEPVERLPFGCPQRHNTRPGTIGMELGRLAESRHGDDETDRSARVHKRPALERDLRANRIAALTFVTMVRPETAGVRLTGSRSSAKNPL